MKKLITIDLDGTTLNDQHVLSPFTIETLKKVQQLGHTVVITTGRPYRNSKHFYTQLQMDGPMVNFNGALCHHPIDLSWKHGYNRHIDQHIVYELLETHAELGANLMMVEGKECLYSSKKELPSVPYYPQSHQIELLTHQTSLSESITAITLFSSEEAQVHLTKQLYSLYPQAINVQTWGGDYPCLEIVPFGINKAVATEHLAHVLGFKREDILSFGDEENDVEMIDFAGHGVAMKNAIEQVKKVANDVTPYTNDEDGVAKYLIHYLHLR